METAEIKKDTWESCGELVNGQPCGKESAVEAVTPAGKKIYICFEHSRIGRKYAAPIPLTSKQSLSKELATGSWNWVRFLWQAGIILAALYLLVGFIKWAWFHS